MKTKGCFIHFDKENVTLENQRHKEFISNIIAINVYNYSIVTLPMELIDYIVVHELCHIYHMNHDRSFWRKIGSIMPDYKKRMKMLNGEKIKR